MSRAIEERIAAATGRQHGVATYRQLLEAGLSPSGVARRTRSGRLRRLHQGVFLVAHFPLPHTREMAAVLASGPGAVLSHITAASLWGLRPAPRPPLGAGADGADSAVDVTVVGNRGRCRGVRVHRVRRLADDERTVNDGLPITTPGRTLMDLAGTLGTQELEMAVTRAERDGLVAPEALSSLVAGRRGRAGMRALRAVLRIPGGPALTRSAAEAKLLALVREARLPAPECSVSLGPYEIDFLWRAAGIAVEVDGFRYHASRPRLEGDRRKDAQLLAAGIAVVRLSWRQITQEPIATAVQLGQALALARRGRSGIASAAQFCALTSVRARGVVSDGALP